MKLYTLNFIASQLFLVLLCCFFPVCVSATTPLTSFTSEYSKTTTSGSTKNTIKGTIYYQNPNLLIYLIQEPISQWIIYQDKATLFYYPDKKLVYRFKRTVESFESSLQSFQLGFTDDDLELANLGYTLQKKEITTNSLRLHWQPPTPMQKTLKEVILSYADDHLTSIEIINTKNIPLMQYQFSNFITVKTKPFPLEITTVNNVGSMPSLEVLSYLNPQFDVVLPESITEFKIPNDVTIKDY